MTLSLNNLTFIIVTFKSDHIIHECIKSLPKDSNIIIIENSNSLEFKKKIEAKYSKINVIVQENTTQPYTNPTTFDSTVITEDVVNPKITQLNDFYNKYHLKPNF